MRQRIAKLKEARRALAVASAVLFVAVIALPVWKITIDAPQYPFTLVVEVYSYPRLGGDWQEVHGLNRYVGFYYPDPVLIEPHFDVHHTSIRTPEWVFGPVALAAVALATLYAGLKPEGSIAQTLGRVFTAVVVFGAAAVAWVQYRLYQAGHTLDPDAQLRGVDSFTPPVIGPYEVANLDGFSQPATGGYVALSAFALLFFAFLLRDTDASVAELPRLAIAAPGNTVEKLKGFRRRLSKGEG